MHYEFVGHAANPDLVRFNGTGTMWAVDNVLVWDDNGTIRVQYYHPEDPRQIFTIYLSESEIMSTCFYGKAEDGEN